MLIYTLQRIGLAILICITSMCLLFGALHLIPGDMATILLGSRATKEMRDELSHEMGLDRPVPVQLCQAPPVLDPGTGLPRNGSCKLHGGRSTGPQIAEGRERIAEAQRRRWTRRAVASMSRVPSAVWLNDHGMQRDRGTRPPPSRVPPETAGRLVRWHWKHRH